MKKVTDEEARKLQMEMMHYLHEVCIENNIEYTLAGGSLLGAIRHGGYIPWDDDIDIELTRPNYDKLMQILMNTPHENYSLIYYKVSEAYLPFAKLYDNRTTYKSKVDTSNPEMGVFVDVFPMDLVPDELQELNEFKQKVRTEITNLAVTNPRGVAYASATKWKYFFGKLVLWFPRHLKYSGKNKEQAQNLDMMMQEYQNKPANKIMYLATGYKNAIFPKEIWEHYEDVAFEDTNFRKLVDHDTYLKLQYGDYMTPPAENKRHDHRFYQFYWK